jgi:eukaryotic-like serine/threonine-protein kinase
MKRFLVGIGLFAVVYWCSVWAQDAPMFRGDLQHTGVYSSVGAHKFNGIKWKSHTDGRVISSPAVVDGVVYVGSTDGNLYAVDAASGGQKWFSSGVCWRRLLPEL